MLCLETPQVGRLLRAEDPEAAAGFTDESLQSLLKGLCKRRSYAAGGAERLPSDQDWEDTDPEAFWR